MDVFCSQTRYSSSQNHLLVISCITYKSHDIFILDKWRPLEETWFILLGHDSVGWWICRPCCSKARVRLATPLTNSHLHIVPKLTSAMMCENIWNILEQFSCRYWCFFGSVRPTFCTNQIYFEVICWVPSQDGCQLAGDRTINNPM